MKVYRILFLALTLLLSIQTTWAQSDIQDQRKIEKAERKRLKEEERQKSREMAMALVKEKAYVLEATTLAGRYRQYQVSPSTNFVKVEGDQIIIQTGDDFRMGYNGLGGITIHGTIGDYEISEGKNGATVNIRFSDPVLGHSTLNMSIQGNGQARATVLGNWGGRATFHGQLVPLEDARVYKGQSII